ncbi:prolipoprotein diacylglyceryl transferase [uncultured Algimonas sp.]|uniref:prolipoprotein diacylglyceryl transferase n=1 Tax=uncultured Algimonas sp. TaxID=1547920 RepID=UPI002608215F|nr:prolipoprotein diacylglyceryl transferase [uncultured Algimonas sp.]
MISLIDLFGAIVFPTWLDETALEIGPVSVKWYGIAYVVGLFAAYLYAVRIAETGKHWLPPGPTRGPQIIPTREDLSDLMFYAFLGILIGGRIGFVLLYSIDMIWTAPFDVLKIWDGGMSFHGGFLGVCAAVGYAAWRKKTSYMRFADLACIGAPIGLGLVRITNFVNQELYGHPTDLPWGVIFQTAPDSLPRHPSQLYEAFLEGFVLWLILRVLTTRFKGLTKPGLITGVFVMGYGVFRFMVEFVRTPDNIPQFGMLTRGMAYSLPMVAVGLGVAIWAARRAAVEPAYASRRIGTGKTATPGTA